MASSAERTGVLVLRVWVERDPRNDVLKARITEVSDVEQGELVARLASNIDDICAIVRDWLERFAVTQR